MTVSFKIATEEDLKGIIELCNECFSENTSYEYALKVYNETKTDPNNIYIIGLIDNKIIAHCKISIIRTIYENMNTYAILNHVCVKEEYRRHHIATKMLDLVTKICLDKGVKTLELWSKNVRTAAHSCYKNYGFQLDDAGFFSKRISE